VIYRLTTIKIPIAFFIELEKLNPKVCKDAQQFLNSQNTMRKKNNHIGIIPLLSFRIYYKALENKQLDIKIQADQGQME
jgi:hypothetical protein